MDALVSEAARQGMSRSTLSHIKRREQAIVLHRGGHIDHAIEFYKAYLKHNPGDGNVWSNLGACLRTRKKYQSALACHQRALSIEPNNTAALGNLGNVLKDLHRLDQAIEIQHRVVASKPEDVQSLVNLASALREYRKFDEALAQLDLAWSLESDNAAVRWERGQNLLHLGEYREGFEAYEARWETGELPIAEFSCPRWQGEALDGKRIVLHAEQGYGDTLLAARYVRMVKEMGAYVVLQCKTELHRLFAGIGADRLIAPHEHCALVNYHCPMMSLMAIFKTSTRSVPAPVALSTDARAQRKFADLALIAADCLKVGIVWSGSVTFKNNDNRAVSLDRFSALAENSELRLFSFQQGPKLDELYDSGADAFIDNIGSQCDDFADTAAALAQMDVIVMTDSSLAHLAGSLGKPVINLLQYVPYWIYSLDDSTTPWYPSHRLIKQQQPGEWDFVFEQAATVLKAMAADKHSTHMQKD